MGKWECNECPFSGCVLDDTMCASMPPKSCPHTASSAKWRKVDDPAHEPKSESEPGRYSRIDDNAIPPCKLDPAYEPEPDAPTRLNTLASTLYTKIKGGQYFISVECPGCKAKDADASQLRAEIARLKNNLAVSEKESADWEKTAGEISDRSARQAGEIEDLKVALADKYIAALPDTGAKLDEIIELLKAQKKE